jgi:hypothetical protein
MFYMFKGQFFTQKFVHIWTDLDGQLMVEKNPTLQTNLFKKCFKIFFSFFFKPKLKIFDKKKAT